MPSAASTALTTMVTDFQTDAVDTVVAVLPIAAVLAITVGVIFLGIRVFRAIAHV